jgi:hypothetical protein
MTAVKDRLAHAFDVVDPAGGSWIIGTVSVSVATDLLMPLVRNRVAFPLLAQ